MHRYTRSFQPPGSARRHNWQRAACTGSTPSLPTPSLLLSQRRRPYVSPNAVPPSLPTPSRRLSQRRPSAALPPTSTSPVLVSFVLACLRRRARARNCASMTSRIPKQGRLDLRVLDSSPRQIGQRNGCSIVCSAWWRCRPRQRWPRRRRSMRGNHCKAAPRRPGQNNYPPGGGCCHGAGGCRPGGLDTFAPRQL